MSTKVNKNKFLRISNISLALAMLLFGIISSDVFRLAEHSSSIKVIILCLILYSIPLLGQFLPYKLLRVYSLWFGVFLIIQTIISFNFYSHRANFVTLVPNLDTTINIVGNAMPGLHGIQHITTDSMGYRTIPRVDYQKKKGIRIFAIGGSTTVQGLLDDKKTWIYLLQQELKNLLHLPVEVINTGVSGLRAENHLSTLIEILPYKPDIVLFLVGVNDWNRHIISHFNSTYNIKYLFKDTLLAYAIKNLYHKIKGLLIQSDHRQKKIKIKRGEYYSKQNNSLQRKTKRIFRPRSVLKEYKAQVEKISKICVDNKIKCIFITQPVGYSEQASDAYKKSFWMTPPNQNYTLDLNSLIYISNLYNSYLKKFAKFKHFEVIDLASKLTPGHENFYDEVHFNTQGAKNVADVLTPPIAEVIRKMKSKAKKHGIFTRQMDNR